MTKTLQAEYDALAAKPALERWERARKADLAVQIRSAEIEARAPAVAALRNDLRRDLTRFAAAWEADFGSDRKLLKLVSDVLNA